MSDPHVESLTYILCPSPGLKFQHVPTIQGETGEFAYDLVNDKLTVHMKANYASSSGGAGRS